MTNEVSDRINERRVAAVEAQREAIMKAKEVAEKLATLRTSFVTASEMAFHNLTYSGDDTRLIIRSDTASVTIIYDGNDKYTATIKSDALISDTTKNINGNARSRVQIIDFVLDSFKIR